MNEAYHIEVAETHKKPHLSSRVFSSVCALLLLVSSFLPQVAQARSFAAANVSASLVVVSAVSVDFLGKSQVESQIAAVPRTLSAQAQYIEIANIYNENGVPFEQAMTHIAGSSYSEAGVSGIAQAFVTSGAVPADVAVNSFTQMVGSFSGGVGQKLGGAFTHFANESLTGERTSGLNGVADFVSASDFGQAFGGLSDGAMNTAMTNLPVSSFSGLVSSLPSADLNGMFTSMGQGNASSMLSTFNAGAVSDIMGGVVPSFAGPVMDNLGSTSPGLFNQVKGLMPESALSSMGSFMSNDVLTGLGDFLPFDFAEISGGGSLIPNIGSLTATIPGIATVQSALGSITATGGEYFSSIVNIYKGVGASPAEALKHLSLSSISGAQLGNIAKEFYDQGLAGATEIFGSLKEIGLTGVQGLMGKATEAFGPLLDNGIVTSFMAGDFMTGMKGLGLPISSIANVINSISLPTEINGLLDALGGMGASALGALAGLIPAALSLISALANPAAIVIGMIQSAAQQGLSYLTGAISNAFGVNLGSVPINVGSMIGGGGASTPYDDTYKDMALTGPRVQGSRPPVNSPLYAKTTDKIVPVTDLTPYLYKDLRVDGKYYDGNAYKYPKGSKYYIDKIIGTESPSEAATPNTYNRRINACIHMLEPKSGLPADMSPALIRLMLDNCSNQYILNNSSYISQNYNKTFTGIDQSSCQPLEMMPVPEDEYDLSTYLSAAWTKLLRDPTYLMRNGDAPKEPSYDIGITLKNTNHQTVQMPTLPPKSLPINVLSLNKQEEIIDPSHPFSPRWDFETNEVDKYEPIAVSKYGGKDSVYCSGDLTNKLKVDIMEFREAPWHKRIMKRIDYNEACYKNMPPAASPCCKWKWKPCGFSLCPICIPQSCFTCFKYPPPTLQPPCGTSYLMKDRLKVRGIPIYLGPRATGQYSYYVPHPGLDGDKAKCGKPSIQQACHDLAKPLVPINKLKMRPLEDLKDGYNEGLGFKDYFGTNRPYMRLWDTGTEAFDTLGKPSYGIDKGADIAIVGVGREQPDGRDGDERCMIGGGGGVSPASGVSVPATHGITSWAELKLYQARTMRNTNLSCIGRYDAIFKPSSAEDATLDQLGGRYTVVSDQSGGNFVRETRTAPLAWRGYLSDTKQYDAVMANGGTQKINRGFPFFSSQGPMPSDSFVTGLDDAREHDVLMLDKGASGSLPGIPTLGIVKKTNLAHQYGGTPPAAEWVEVQIYNHGKYPDSCGTTDAAELERIGAIRRFYKLASALDDGLLKAANDVAGTQWTTDCEDPNLSQCVFSNWNGVTLYRPQNDVRTREVNR